MEACESLVYSGSFESCYGRKIIEGSNPSASAMFFNFFKKTKKEPKDFKEILFNFQGLEKDFEKLSKDLADLKKESRFSVQKVSLVRYNPFSEIGGDQSFSIALLDANNDGVVITSLYTRAGNRVYGKPIKNSQSEYQLSDEEKKAIEGAKAK